MPLSRQRFARFSCFYSKKLKSMSLEETQISRCLYHILWTYVNSFEILHTLGMSKRRIHFSMLFFLKLGYTLWADSDVRVYVCMCRYAIVKVLIHLKEFHENWYEPYTTGGHVSAGRLDNNNNRADTTNWSDNRNTYFGSETIYGNGLWKKCATFSKKYECFYKMTIITWKQCGNCFSFRIL